MQHLDPRGNLGLTFEEKNAFLAKPDDVAKLEQNSRARDIVARFNHHRQEFVLYKNSLLPNSSYNQIEDDYNELRTLRVEVEETKQLIEQYQKEDQSNEVESPDTKWPKYWEATNTLLESIDREINIIAEKYKQEREKYQDETEGVNIEKTRPLPKIQTLSKWKNPAGHDQFKFINDLINVEPTGVIKLDSTDTSNIDRFLKNITGGWILRKILAFGSAIYGGTISTLGSLNKFLDDLFARFLPESLYNTRIKGIALKSVLVVPVSWFLVKKSSVMITEVVRYIVGLFVGNPQPPPEVPPSILDKIQSQWSNISNPDNALLQTTYNACIDYFGSSYTAAGVLASAICAIVSLIIAKKYFFSAAKYRGSEIVDFRQNKRQLSKTITRSRLMNKRQKIQKNPP